MKQSDISDSNTQLFRIIDKNIRKKYHNAKVLPFITPVGTDAKVFLERKEYVVMEYIQ